MRRQTERSFAGRLRAVAGLLALACVLLNGCSPGTEGKAAEEQLTRETKETGKTEDAQTEAAKEPVTILIAAAASLEYALSDQLIPLFEGQYPMIRVEGSYDSSGRLMSQIENGLEADLFLPASEKQMLQLEREDLIELSSIRPLLENELVLIVPAGRAEGYAQFTDIGKADFPAVGDPAIVPAGQYAKEALMSLGLWEEISGRCSLGANVTEVLGWVESGSADAGLVYATDAAATDRVEVVAKAPEGSLAEKIIYPAGIVGASKQKEAAALFLQFLQSDEAAKVFREYGFTPCSGTEGQRAKSVTAPEEELE